MKGRWRWLFTLFQVFIDFFAIGAAVFAAQRVQRYIKPESVDRFLHYAPYALLFALVVILTSYLRRGYHWQRPSGILDSFSKALGTVTIAFLVALAAVVFFLPDQINPGVAPFPRGFLLVSWGLGVGFITLGRWSYNLFVHLLQRRGIGRQKVLVVGSGDIGRMLIQKLQGSHDAGHRVVGYIEANGEEIRVADLPRLGLPSDIPEVIEQYAIDEVVIGLPEASHRELVRIISLCEREKVSIKVFPDVFQIMATEVSVSDLAGLPLLSVRDVALRGWKLSLKRAYDLAIAVPALIFLSPFMLLIALLIKLESPGPVFYIQERMGLDARPFPMIKFRSMRIDAESRGPGWTTPDDPRKTRLGTILRKLSVDELPQLINVIRGDMSVVGPRPERPVYVEQFRQYIPRYMERHREKAGMTGWAQINGLRGDTSIVERTKYDLWYIENWSLWLDFKITLLTFVRIFTDRNAY
ncbi:MAG TPA: undecaprenyl-phosphate glucose phosphotransferase [Anaerolineae bacterium]|nr:undecaprenyl-phosphate glucose phosphotransferase [Caldilineae bacterium]HID35449.1 undecaprenyl-phosphate glucose phosphotransferase [Anaerolineae bacterium]